MALSTSAKPPSFYALGHPLVGNPDLRSESTRQAEAYYEWDRAPATYLRITAFDARFQDLVDFDPGPPPRLVNRSRIDSTGVEVNASHEWSPRLEGFVQATLLQIDRPDGAEPLRHRPEQQGSLGVRIRPGESWDIHAALVHVGRRWDSSIPTGGRWLAVVNDVQVAMTRRFGRWEIFGAVDNLFDTDAEETLGTAVGERRVRVGFRIDSQKPLVTSHASEH